MVLGWFVLRDTSSGKIVFHTGEVPGAICIFVRNLTRNKALFCLTMHSARVFLRSEKIFSR